MNNKKVISLAALLAIMAFAVVPTAAQALEGPEGNKSPVHWQVNGTRSATGTLVPVIDWGTAKFEFGQPVQCKTAAAGNDTNTAAGKAASEVVMFATYECKGSGECSPPAEQLATAVNLTPDAVPNTGVWPSIIVEEGPANAEEKFRAYDLSGTGAGENPIKVKIECFAGGENVGNLLFQSGEVKTPVGHVVGSSTPLITNGSSPTKPSETNFEDPLKETGHLYAASEAELVKEETVEPTVKLTFGSPVLKDEGKTWQALIKTGCRVKAAKLFANDLVKTVLTTTELQLENKANPGKEIGLENTVEPVKFNCGALTPVPIEGTTKGKVKFVGYLDNQPTPLITIGTSVAP